MLLPPKIIASPHTLKVNTDLFSEYGICKKEKWILCKHLTFKIDDVSPLISLIMKKRDRDTDSLESGLHWWAANLEFEFELFCHAIMPYSSFPRKPNPHIGTWDMRNQKPMRKQRFQIVSNSHVYVWFSAQSNSHKLWL